MLNLSSFKKQLAFYRRDAAEKRREKEKIDFEKEQRGGAPVPGAVTKAVYVCKICGAKKWYPFTWCPNCNAKYEG